MNEVDPRILQTNIAEEASEVFVCVGVEQVHVAKDDNRIASGIIGDILLKLLVVGPAGFLVPLCVTSLRFQLVVKGQWRKLKVDY